MSLKPSDSPDAETTRAASRREDSGTGSLLASSHDAQRDSMTVERARVIAVDADATSGDSVWVETLQGSTCSGCAARSACGQGVMRRWFSRDSLCLELHRDDGDDRLYAVGQWVEIAIPQGVVVRAAMLAYMLPILAMLLAVALGSALFASEALVLLAAVAGFVAGIVLARTLEAHYLGQRSCQPRLLGPAH